MGSLPAAVKVGMGAMMRIEPMNGLTPRGSALILTLWCVAILSVMIVTLARVVDADVDASSLATKRFEARELALTGLAFGLNPQVERGNALLRQRFENGDALDVAVTSESARINVNEVLADENDETLADLFELWEIPEELSRVAVDSLRDWVDENDLRSLNGAEEEDLFGQTRYSIPENRNFISVDEMERVRGMDEVIAQRPNWEDVFSVYSLEQLDVQDASLDVLRVAVGLSTEQAGRLIESRNGPDEEPQTDDDLIFENLDQVASVVGLSESQRQALNSRFAVGVEPTRIESVGTTGGVSYRITVIVERGGAAPNGGAGGGGNGGGGGADSILSWEEG